MAKRWTLEEEGIKRNELLELYVKRNKTISEISSYLKIKESTVYDRLVRLNISSERYKKPRCNNQRIDKDEYVEYVSELIYKLFNIKPRVSLRKSGDYVIYFGSTKTVRWLLDMGLMFNKVRGQVNIPNWIFTSNDFMRHALRGLIDTDGSIYKLKFGIQISFTNFSKPLLSGVRNISKKLGFHPSKISGARFYLTKREDISKFIKEIGFGNKKHLNRFLQFQNKDGRVA